MNNTILIVFVVIGGLYFSYFIGNSKIANSNLGVELPIGWEVDSYSDGPCNAIDLGARGVPLANWRQSTESSCGTDTNTLASSLNYLTGVLVAVGTYFALGKLLKQ